MSVRGISHLWVYKEVEFSNCFIEVKKKNLPPLGSPVRRLEVRYYRIRRFLVEMLDTKLYPVAVSD